MDVVKFKVNIVMKLYNFNSFVATFGTVFSIRERYFNVESLCIGMQYIIGIL